MINKYLAVTTLLFIFAPTLLTARGKNEWSVSINNGILLNHSDVESTVSPSITDFKNTYTNSIGLQYTRVTKFGLLLSAGVHMGNEKYHLLLHYPFQDYGFYYPNNTSFDNYQFEKNIPYARINLHIGYRFNNIKFRPEIRLGQSLNMPFGSLDLSKVDYQLARTGFESRTYYSYGFVGKSNVNDFVAELITTGYVGINIPSKLGRISNYSVGVLVQRKMLLSNYLNYYDVHYLDFFGEEKSHELFKGHHMTISLSLGVTF